MVMSWLEHPYVQARRARGIMKYRDLIAVGELDREEMSKVVGGISWGQLIHGAVQGVGRAHEAGAIEGEEFFQVKNLGQLTQAVAELTGYPGNNGPKKFLSDLLGGVDVPPGLPPGN